MLVLRQARVPVPARLRQRRRPDPARPKNTYVREDQILPHPAALAILLAGDGSEPEPGGRALARLTGPDRTADLIGQLRADGTVLTCDPDDRTLSAGDRNTPPVVVAEDHQHRASERRTA